MPSREFVDLAKLFVFRKKISPVIQFLFKNSRQIDPKKMQSGCLLSEASQTFVCKPLESRTLSVAPTSSR
jgi:hypothetical protein